MKRDTFVPLQEMDSTFYINRERKSLLQLYHKEIQKQVNSNLKI